MAILAIAAIAVAACGDDDDAGGDTTVAAAATTAAAADTTAAGGDTTAAAADTTAAAADTTAPASDTTEAAAPSGWEVDTEDCPDTATEPITDTIKVGISVPLSGSVAVAFAPVADGAKAYVDYLNANGGINGQQVELIVKDDQYDPTITATNTDELIDSDGINLMSGTIGTANNLAIQETMNEECIPQLFANTGALDWGDVENYPWTTGLLPTYEVEAKVHAAKIQEDFPEGAQVAYFSVNNEFGQANVDAFNRAIEGTNIEIVSEETIEGDPTASPSGQIANMKASGANVLIAIPLGGQCIGFKTEMANAGFAPELWFETSTCANPNLFYSTVGPAAEGVMTTGVFKNFEDPQFVDDEDVVLFVQESQKIKADIDPYFAAVGWTLMDATADVLTSAAEAPDGLTPASIINAARSQNYHPALVVDGIDFVMNGADDPYGLETVLLQAFSTADDLFHPVGEPYDYEGQIEFVES